MNFYEVLPRDTSYRLDNPLTYSYSGRLFPGNLVEIPLKEKQVIGFVIQKVDRPSFTTKDITKAHIDLPPLPAKTLKLLFWLHEYYPGPMGAVIQQFLPKSLTVLAATAPNNTKKQLPKTLPPLTKEQSKTLKEIKPGHSTLIHGDTGTGKTRIYIELAMEALETNKSSLILTPEISLTSQLTEDFRAVFGDKVILIHSGLSDKARLASWIKILNYKEPLVILGPRSALFSPLQNIGLIVVDEEHEEAYKQEQSPHYNAVRAAAKLASIHKATFVMGSATPSVVDFYIAEHKNIPILRMKELAVTQETKETKITVINMADKDQVSRNPYLSNRLLELLAKL